MQYEHGLSVYLLAAASRVWIYCFNLVVERQSGELRSTDEVVGSSGRFFKHNYGRRGTIDDRAKYGWHS